MSFAPWVKYDTVRIMSPIAEMCDLIIMLKVIKFVCYIIKTGIIC